MTLSRHLAEGKRELEVTGCEGCFLFSCPLCGDGRDPGCLRAELKVLRVEKCVNWDSSVHKGIRIQLIWLNQSVNGEAPGPIGQPSGRRGCRRPSSPVCVPRLRLPGVVWVLRWSPVTCCRDIRELRSPLAPLLVQRKERTPRPTGRKRRHLSSRLLQKTQVAGF